MSRGRAYVLIVPGRDVQSICDDCDTLATVTTQPTKRRAAYQEALDITRLHNEERHPDHE